MALSKVTYTDGLNIITADNLNDIQDEIIANAASISTEATARENADTTLQTNITNEATARANADALKQNITDNTLTTTAKTVVGAINELDDDVDDINDELDNKADLDGYYETLSVGLADNLIDRKGDGTEQKFVYRTSCGTDSVEDDGSAEIKSLHGNTIVWNQLVDSATTDVTVTSGNKYRFYDKDGTDTIVTSSGGSFSVTGGDDMVFDLTAMFGNGNEPSTVAEFKKMFPLDYYAYNAGSLLSYNGTGIKTVGFNQFDVSNVDTTAWNVDGETISNKLTDTKSYFEFQIQGINDSGSTNLHTVQFNSTGRKTVTYTFSNSYKRIRIKHNGSAQDFTVLNINNIFFLQEYCFSFNIESCNPKVVGGLIISNININLSWSGYRNGEYEPYWTQTRSLPVSTYFPNGMRSAGSAYDELTKDKAITRIGSQSVTGAVGDTITLTGCSTTETAYLCAKGDIGTLSGGVLTLTVAVTSETILFPLATPTETTISPPLNLDYKVADFGTEQSLPENTSTPTTSTIDAVIKYTDDFTRDLATLPKSYDTTAGLDALASSLASALSSALDGTFTITRGAYDTSTKKYAWTCSFTANTEG